MRRERRARKDQRRSTLRDVKRRKRPAERLERIKTGVVETIEQRRAKAMALRVRGYTFRQIGAALGCTKDTACEDVHAVVLECRRMQEMYGEELWVLQMERYSTLLVAWFDKSRTDPSVLDRVLRLLSQVDEIGGLKWWMREQLGAGGNGSGSAASPLMGMTPEALAVRVEHVHRRIAEAAATIDWSKYDQVGSTAAVVDITTTTPKKDDAA